MVQQRSSISVLRLIEEERRSSRKILSIVESSAAAKLRTAMQPHDITRALDALTEHQRDLDKAQTSANAVRAILEQARGPQSFLEAATRRPRFPFQ